jgi:hypothetical protein
VSWRSTTPNEILSHRRSPENPSILQHSTLSQNGSTILIGFLARIGIYGTAETNVNRKIIPAAETSRPML